MIHNVVFTGPAVDGSGMLVLRANLVEACQATGKFRVQKSVRADTTILVASRKDTVKAKAAAARGTAVVSYPEFFNRYLRGVTLPKGGAPNSYTDKVDKDLLVPDFVEPEQLEGLDIL